MKYKNKATQEIISAIRFTGNDKECIAFCPIATNPQDNRPSLLVAGRTVQMGDYIIKNSSGNYIVCPRELFNENFQSVDSRNLLLG